MLLPTKTELVAAILLRNRSASGMFVATADAELFCNARSVTAEATLAVLVKVPLPVAAAVMMTVAMALLARLPSAQVTIPFVCE